MDELIELRRELRLQARAEELRLRLDQAPARPTELAEVILECLEELVGKPANRAVLTRQAVLAQRVRDPQRLLQADLLGLREQAVEEVWRSGRPSRAQSHPQRIFAEDEEGQAWPLGEQAVLYLGASVADAERHLLSLLCRQGGRLLDLALRVHALEDSLQASERSRRGLLRWVEDGRVLHQGSTGMSSTLRRDGMLAHLQQTLETLCPGSRRCVVLQAQIAAWEPEGDAAAALALAALVGENQRPLLVDDLSGGSLPQVWPDQASLLAVPLLSETGPVGAILLGSPERAVYRREQQDQLSILSFQAAVLLRNAGLHEDLREAFESLRESRAMLVQSSKLAAVGELAAGLAHELNTPLATVLLSIETLGMLWEDPPERARKRLEMALREAERAHQLVEKLLYYARDASQAADQTSARVLVEDTLQIIAHSLAGLRVEVGTLPEASLWCNANEIQQVLINLCLNARDALQQTDSPRLRLWAEESEGWLRFVVQDNGQGIADEVLERIFDPFFTTRPVGKGTGLGLSISRQIVHAHGGEMGVESCPGAGSTFWFRLPPTGTRPVPA